MTVGTSRQRRCDAVLCLRACTWIPGSGPWLRAPGASMFNASSVATGLPCAFAASCSHLEETRSQGWSTGSMDSIKSETSVAAARPGGPRATRRATVRGPGRSDHEACPKAFVRRARGKVLVVGHTHEAFSARWQRGLGSEPGRPFLERHDLPPRSGAFFVADRGVPSDGTFGILALPALTFEIRTALRSDLAEKDQSAAARGRSRRGRVRSGAPEHPHDQSAVATTCSTSSRSPGSFAARQSGNRLNVVWPDGQYHRATRIPSGITRPYVPRRRKPHPPAGCGGHASRLACRDARSVEHRSAGSPEPWARTGDPSTGPQAQRRIASSLPRSAYRQEADLFNC